MTLNLPDLSLVVLVGASSAGKSTFARTHFRLTEIVSSDQCRALVSDDENNQAASADAFDLLHFLVGKRLRRGLLTVVDATNVQPEARRPLVELARQYHVLPVAIVFDLPLRVLRERHGQRTDRDFREHVLQRHQRDLKQSLRTLSREGFRHVFVFETPEEVAEATLQRTPLYNDRRGETGPFDLIGDVHGCYDELVELLGKLGYAVATDPEAPFGVRVRPPEGRKAVFLGDLVDRGPASPAVLRLVMSMVQAGTALCVPGNHDFKLLRKLRGRDVKVSHGLAETLAQLADEPADFVEAVKTFLDGLVSHYVLAGGSLVVAHAGLREEMHGRASGAVRSFCLYGETTGETDEFGLPVRFNWAADYKGRAAVVYGHTPVPTPEWLNNTLNIDTGCVFGGALTALRSPEKELVSVPARREYAKPARPLAPPVAGVVSAQHAADDVLDLADVTGKRRLETRYAPPVAISEESSIAALEVVSRFAVDPKWLIYLPPTMSPTETSPLPGWLEHPAEAFAYFRAQGVAEVVCEEKHMGSRAVVVLTRTDEVAQTRFGLPRPAAGSCYTRTGRAFFAKQEVERAALEKLRKALDASDFWEKLNTDWVCLDAELMPWSAKAGALIEQQYAAVGAAGRHALDAANAVLAQAAGRRLEVGELQVRFSEKRTAVERFGEAFRRYCRDTDGLDGLVLAPFHVLATEGAVHADKPHRWHLDTIADFCAADPEFLLATPFRTVRLDDPAGEADATAWWEALTAAGGEGMVVKPADFLVRTSRGLVQPAVKCRGREYLRIIYGPEYDLPEHLARLKSRNLGHKRSLALRELALGLEALDRFVAREPQRRVHECVFGVLALESEEVDPRL